MTTFERAWMKTRLSLIASTGVAGVAVLVLARLA